MITDKELNYDDLASGLKAALQNDPSVFDADRLQKYTGSSLSENLTVAYLVDIDSPVLNSFMANGFTQLYYCLLK